MSIGTMHRRLQNITWACFANSVIQSVFYTSGLWKIISDSETLQTSDSHCTRLLPVLYGVCFEKSLNECQQNSVVCPSAVYSNMKSKSR